MLGLLCRRNRHCEDTGEVYEKWRYNTKSTHLGAIRLGKEDELTVSRRTHGTKITHHKMKLGWKDTNKRRTRPEEKCRGHSDVWNKQESHGALRPIYCGGKKSESRKEMILAWEVKEEVEFETRPE